MTAPYEPPAGEEKSPTKRISIRLSEQETEELHTIADVWQGLDASLGAQRKYKWSAASVMEKMIRGGMKEFWIQVGGRIRDGESRAEFLRRAAAEIRKAQRK